MNLLRLYRTAISHAVETTPIDLRCKITGPHHSAWGVLQHHHHRFMEGQALRPRIGGCLIMCQLYQALQRGDLALQSIDFDPRPLQSVPRLIKVASQLIDVRVHDLAYLLAVLHRNS